MYHIVIETTDKHGNKKKIREEQETKPSLACIEGWEDKYLDTWTYPGNISAVVINVFHTDD